MRLTLKGRLLGDAVTRELLPEVSEEHEGSLEGLNASLSFRWVRDALTCRHLALQLPFLGWVSQVEHSGRRNISAVSGCFCGG